MNTGIGHKASVKQALDHLALDYKSGDTGLQVQSDIVDGQWVRLTSMRDGLQRPPIPRIHAERVLAKTLSNGAPAFWIEGMAYSPPEPQVGTIKCYFHPDFDEDDGPAGIARQFIVESGLGDFTCNSGDLRNQNRGDFKTVMMRDAHMRSRHRRQLDTIERARGNEKDQLERTERQLDREYQRQQTGAMMQLLERQIAATTGTEAPPATTVTLPAVEAPESPPAAVAFACDVCGRESPTKGGVAAHRRLSKDEAHVEARDV